MNDSSSRCAALACLLSVGALVVSIGCSTAAPTAPSTAAPVAPTSSLAATLAGQPITLSVLDDVTGISSIEGALMRVDVDMAVDEMNSSGGINAVL